MAAVAEYATCQTHNGIGGLAPKIKFENSYSLKANGPSRSPSLELVTVCYLDNIFDTNWMLKPC